MESHYSINVSLNGRHLFATDPRSCRTRDEAAVVYAEIRNRFPESAGYSVTVTSWNCNGAQIDPIKEFGKI